jgi:hypothetical protein
MKALIILSIALNVALAGYINLQGRHKRPAAGVEQSVAPEKVLPASSFTARKSSDQYPGTIQVTTVRESDFNWRMVESEDYRTYMRNLRAIGCPENTIRDIIIADIDKLYARKLAPLRRPPSEFKFWMNDQDIAYNRQSDEYVKAQRAGAKEKNELLKQLLGEDYQKDIARENGWNQTDPFEKLSPEARKQAQELTEKFNEERSEFYRKAKNHIDMGTQDDLRALRRKLHDDMAKFLSPQELLDYEARTSETAQNLKYNELQAFDANEAEFKAIFKAKQAADLSQPADGQPNQEWQTRKKEAEAELKEVLGETRYAEYQKAQDYEYQNLVQMVEARGLDKVVIGQIETMKAEAQKTASTLRRNKDMTAEERTEALAAIRNATEAAIQETLGERNFKAYKRNASWMRNLAPPQPAVRSTP